MPFNLIYISAGRLTYLDNDGNPAAGYKLWTVRPSTSTLIDTWLDKDKSGANYNPIILDVRGQAQVWAEESVTLNLCISTSTSPTDGLIQSDEWVGAPTESSFVRCSADVGTTSNIYNVTLVPTPVSLAASPPLLMVPDVDNEDTIVGTVFTGTGINDIQGSGPYTGAAAATFTIQIDSVANPNTVKWKKDGGSWTSGVALTRTRQDIIEGVWFQAAQSTGHTLNDIWTITTRPPARVNVNDLVGPDGQTSHIVYKIKEVPGTGTAGVIAIDGGDMLAGYPAELALNGSYTAYLLLNPATPALTTPTLTALRPRKEITGDYQITSDDQGYQLNAGSDGTWTFDPLSTLAGQIFNGTPGPYTITLETDSGTPTDKINPPYGETAVTSYVLRPGAYNAFQVQSNGVSLNFLNMISRATDNEKWTTYLVAGASTWTRDDRFNLADIIIVGANGGGSVVGTGGAEGGRAEIKGLDITAIISETVTVGAGGSAGVPATHVDGYDGGASSFGSHASATGGKGGPDAATVAFGGTGVDGDINIEGQLTTTQYGARGLYRRGGDIAEDGQDGLVIVREYR